MTDQDRFAITNNAVSRLTNVQAIANTCAEQFTGQAAGEVLFGIAFMVEAITSDLDRVNTRP